MDIPRDFSKLTHAQLLHFAKAGFEYYWEVVNKIIVSKEINSTMQRISQDVIEMQKIINKQNQKVNEELADEVDNR